MLNSIIAITILSIPLVNFIGIIYCLIAIKQINEQIKDRMTTRDTNIKYICSLKDGKKCQFRFSWKQDKGFVYEPTSDSKTFLG